MRIPGHAGKIAKEMLATIAGPGEKGVPRTEARLLARTDSRLTFQAGKLVYRVDVAAGLGLGMRTRVRAELERESFIDRLDLAASMARRNFARACGAKLGVPTREVEDHLCAVADRMDNIEAEVVAASRLLPKPAGAIVRGTAGSGKSELIHGVCKLLPPSEVLYFSRLTPQALFFMPREALLHRLLVVDEYAGLAVEALLAPGQERDAEDSDARTTDGGSLTAAPGRVGFRLRRAN